MEKALVDAQAYCSRSVTKVFPQCSGVYHFVNDCAQYECWAGLAADIFCLQDHFGFNFELCLQKIVSVVPIINKFLLLFQVSTSYAPKFKTSKVLFRWAL